MGSAFLAAALALGIIGQLPYSPVVLTFSGRIDGGDTIDVSPQQAVGTTNYFGTPDSVEFDGLPWDPQADSTLVALVPGGADAGDSPGASGYGPAQRIAAIELAISPSPNLRRAALLGRLHAA